MIVRQDIVTWYRPDEKMPPEYTYVVVTFSGRKDNMTYDHALAIADWDSYTGWELDEYGDMDSLTIHTWCDLEPYKGD